MTKEKLIENLIKQFDEYGWCLDLPAVQNRVLFDVEKDLDLLLKRSKICGCPQRPENIDFAGMM